MSTAHLRPSTVTLDMIDAIELAELLDYLADWLTAAGDDVREDLVRFALDHTAPGHLPAELTRFSRLLVFGDDGTGEQGDQW